MNRVRESGSAVGLLVILLGALVLAGTSLPGHAFTVSGRAFVIYIDVPNAGISAQYLGDTGWIEPTGGDLDVSGLSLSTSVVNTGEYGSRSRGDDCRGSSDYSVQAGLIFPGDPAELGWTHMGGRDDDECCDAEDDAQVGTIEGLTFAGQSIAVTGLYNQVVVVPGVGVLTINEHGSRRGGGGGGGHGGGGGGGHDDDDDEDNCEDGEDHWVNALHLVLDGGGEVIVGGAYFHSHNHCCTVKTSTSTWGSIKALYNN